MGRTQFPTKDPTPTPTQLRAILSSEGGPDVKGQACLRVLAGVSERVVAPHYFTWNLVPLCRLDVCGVVNRRGVDNSQSTGADGGGRGGWGGEGGGEKQSGGGSPRVL